MKEIGKMALALAAAMVVYNVGKNVLPLPAGIKALLS